MTPGFQHVPIDQGITLYVQPTNKFKTVSTYVYIHLPITTETITANALMPMVMARGSETHPTTQDLVRHLDDLYGAAVGHDVNRRGEVHTLLFQLTMPSASFLSGQADILEQGLETLAGLLLRPARQGNGLRPDYVDQERRNLRQMIESLVNDKRRFALQRCREILCAGEPYALFHLGRVQDLDAITPESLLAHHQRVMKEAAIDIFVIGDVEPQRTADLVRRLFPFPRAAGDRHRPITQVLPKDGPVQTVTEEQPINQGVLVLGMRTGAATVRAEEYFPTLVANGILGGFPHSKLFVNVREKNSLAYYAYSAVDSLKGVGFLYAGIEPANYQKAVDIVLEQLRDLQGGAVTEQEYSATIKALSSDALSVQDSPGRIVDQYLSGLMSGILMTPEERSAAYARVTLEQAVAAAQRFNVQTIYFLTKGGGQA